MTAAEVAAVGGMAIFSSPPRYCTVHWLAHPYAGTPSTGVGLVMRTRWSPAHHPALPPGETTPWARSGRLQCHPWTVDGRWPPICLSGELAAPTPRQRDEAAAEWLHDMGAVGSLPSHLVRHSGSGSIFKGYVQRRGVRFADVRAGTGPRPRRRLVTMTGGHDATRTAIDDGG